MLFLFRMKVIPFSQFTSECGWKGGKAMVQKVVGTSEKRFFEESGIGSLRGKG